MGRGSGFRSEGSKSPLRKKWLLALILIVAAVVTAAVFRVGAEPAVDIRPHLPGIGKKTEITIEVREPSRGVGDVEVELVQGDRVVSLGASSDRQRPFWALWGPKVGQRLLEITAEGDKLGLEQGEATLRVTASRAGTWLRRPDPVVVTRTLPVRLVPPTLSVLSSLIYVAQGGSEAVVYRVGAGTERDGVRAGRAWFPGYPLPGGSEGERFALFGVPYDLDDRARVRLEVSDALENVAEVRFLDRFVPKAMRKSTIRLSDSFFEKVVPEIVMRTVEIEEQPSLLESYLAVNGELREINARQLRELAAESESRFLWRRPFRQQRNSQVMDSFASRRTYLYKGEVVDQQDHLGYDLASVRKAPVEAANDGRVVLTRYLGIYGNSVVLDHGYGLMTLYAHLSSIAVEPGQEVERGESLGRTGETGLAGGDHLHFTVLLQGEPVDPVEWFDAKWIRDRLVRKLGTALDFEG